MRVPPLDVIEARVGDDAVDPWSKGQRWIVLMECLVCANERLLCAVRRGVGVARDAQRDVVHPTSVTFDKRGEGVGIACEAPLDDLLIGARQPPASDGFRCPLLTRFTLSPLVLFCGLPCSRCTSLAW